MTMATRPKLIISKLVLLGAALAFASGCSGEGFDDPEGGAAVQEALCVEQALTPVSASASSVETASFPASYAIDGSMTTRWSSAFSDPQWLSIDLGASRRISKVVLSWEAAASASYQLQVSADGN